MVSTNKKILRVALMLTYTFIIFILLFLLSSLYTYFNTGADRSAMLHTEVKKVDQYLPKVDWKENGNEGREISDQKVAEILNDYLDSWYVKQASFLSNTRLGIDDYFTKNARKNIFNIIDYNKENNISIESTTLKHNLDLEFFSEDGQLIVLKDNDVVEYKKTLKNNEIIMETSEISDYKAVLLLEDGFWRIRHLVKEATKDFDKTTTAAQFDFTTLKGINYYPQATPWDMYGDQFDINIIKNDFKIIKDAKLNSIRIFVPYADFGKANVKEDKLQKLQLVLDAALEVDLKVVVTLFDFYGNYNVLDWTLNHRHAEKIVDRFKDHKAIIAWDVKNEPNLDFDSRGKANVIAWLEFMIITIKEIDKNHPITIGWSNVESATILKDQLDIISFHYYEDIADLDQQYLTLKTKIKDKPIVLQEFGLSSYGGFWRPFASSEKKQAEYYKEIQKVLTKNSISFMSWTLYDFDVVPKEVLGRLPWRTNPQKKFGFINNKGEKKLSYKYISN
ncbi:glycoside hydrolase family 5 protein [Polaribacter vadi]|uniref:glycoside hydrolase family 2 TIM barrel-domain containing protein n=1 Tax=Polaribacter TaxID=52959 RepID=UPI001C092320|nr:MULTISPECIES: glycoside hydrolase family 2 TIM barrel-domain containing protein [Polaribacter]MBU3013059.1 glycoside hydrolase family 5 protein [Polaribacter vadi]MDO6742877.1 cellulase family glycosylhydrolase [Polaribacter sp. 1_MG-2023]